MDGATTRVTKQPNTLLVIERKLYITDVRFKRTKNFFTPNLIGHTVQNSLFTNVRVPYGGAAFRNFHISDLPIRMKAKF
jgi:hypothetical protein